MDENSLLVDKKYFYYREDYTRILEYVYIGSFTNNNKVFYEFKHPVANTSHTLLSKYAINNLLYSSLDQINMIKKLRS